jgi:ribosomal protein L32
MIDYQLLMRRAMGQYLLVADGATTSLDPMVHGSGEHPSRVLTAPGVVRVSECQKCHKETRGRRFCPSCGAETEIVYASLYVLQDWWHRAHSEERKRALVKLTLELIRTARVRQRQNLDMHTSEGRFELGVLMVSGALTARRVAEVYGFGERHAWKLKAAAKAEIDRLDAEAQLPYGTLDDRTRIATAIDRTKVDNGS